jgi:hypothetical protein
MLYISCDRPTRLFTFTIDQSMITGLTFKDSHVRISPLLDACILWRTKNGVFFFDLARTEGPCQRHTLSLYLNVVRHYQRQIV